MHLDITSRTALKAHALNESQSVIAILRVKRPNIRTEDAEDVASQALLTWLEHLELGRLRRPETPRSWLFITALRLLDGQTRRNRRMVQLDTSTLDPVGDDGHTPPTLDARDFAELMIASGLSFLDREIIRLKDCHELPWDEVQAALDENISLPALWQRHSRAIKKLQRYAASELRRGGGGIVRVNTDPCTSAPSGAEDEESLACQIAYWISRLYARTTCGVHHCIPWRACDFNSSVYNHQSDTMDDTIPQNSHSDLPTPSPNEDNQPSAPRRQDDDPAPRDRIVFATAGSKYSVNIELDFSAAQL